MGNFSTKAVVTYPNLRVMGDVKHLPAKGDKDAVTFVPFGHSSKGNDAVDLWGDANIKFRAEEAATLKKGDYITITGKQAFKKDNKGNVRIIVYVEDFQLLGNLKDRLQPVTEAPADSGGAESAADDDGECAFE